jgi:uncharacterized protein YbjT (DUF2867 family)
MKIAVAGATGRVGHHVVDLLSAGGHEVIAISRSNGVDIITGEGLAKALAGVETLIDAAGGPSPEQEAATKFFLTAAQNLQEAGARARVKHIVVISIIGIDRFTAGYMVSKVAHEKAMLSGPIPASILHAAQFHEFVDQFVAWSMRGEVSYVPRMRTQLVAARSVAEALVTLALSSPAPPASRAAPIVEIAGPRAENLVDVAVKLAAKRGYPRRIEAAGATGDPDQALYESGGLLPGPHATLAGPTFEEWLASEAYGESSSAASA